MNVLVLGQSGFLFEIGGVRILIDPYLSDSVADRFGREFTRQIPIVVTPADLGRVDWLLLTHAHLDHTDADTLGPVLAANPGLRAFAPGESREILADLGAAPAALRPPPLAWTELTADVEVRAIPAAHTALERDAAGEGRYVGFLLRAGGVTLYHAGDTVPHAEIFASLAGERIDYALLPVNERNFYRDRAGIVGNLTVREAFQMAADLGARTLVPIHWDLFAPNRTHVAEIELLHELERPPFALEIWPAGTRGEIGKIGNSETRKS